MDIFATTLTSLTLLYKFIDTCTDFPGDAKSLSLRLQWDMRILQKIQEYFAIKQHTNADGNSSLLPPEDEQLLHRVVEYLDDIVRKARTIESKLSSSNRWKKGMTQLTWWHYRPKLHDLQQELHEWAGNFDVHLIALPQELKTAIRLDKIADPPALLKTSERIERVLESVTDLDIQGSGLEIQDRMEILASESSPIAPRTIACYKGEQVLLEYRHYPESLLSEANKPIRDRFLNDQKRLAVILSNSQSTSLGLPKCLGYFDNNDRQKPRFATFTMVFQLPVHDSAEISTSSLREIIDRTEKHHTTHSLTERFKFAHRLSIALLLVHSSGWVHESVSPTNILILDSDHLSKDVNVSSTLGSPLLVGFHLARPDVGDSAPSTLSNSAELNTYIHPRRLGKNTARFVRAFDIYSLGVVLLELGLWRRLSKILARFDPQESDLRPHLKSLVNRVRANMGNTYAEVVMWCLDREEGKLLVDEIMKAVVERLENLSATI